MSVLNVRLTAMPDRMLTLADVSRVLGVTVPTARNLVRRGDIRGFQVGGRGMWRVEQAELDAYVQRKKALAEQRRNDPRGVEAE